ncbi:MAG: hypothetical protein WBB22_03955 [Anaerolineae bacterium]
MRMLKVIRHCFPAWAYGGTLRIVHEVSQRLVQRGHFVTVVTTDALDEEGRIHAHRDPVSVDGIRVFCLRNVSNCSWPAVV